MKKFANKKGFTIVELVIVIAVIAILAAVLIPTFNSVIKKAEESSARQEAKAALELVTLDVPNGDMSTDVYYFEVKDKPNGTVQYTYCYDASKETPFDKIASKPAATDDNYNEYRFRDSNVEDDLSKRIKVYSKNTKKPAAE